MFALDLRKILAVALLATAVAAPASASDALMTTQQAVIGQSYAEAGPADTSGLIVQQSSQLETKAQIAEPNAPKAAIAAAAEAHGAPEGYRASSRRCRHAPAGRSRRRLPRLAPAHPRRRLLMP